MTTTLVKYDAARYALQQAVEIDEVKDIRDKAQAMAAYARQAKDTEMIQWVTEIKVRAERKAGKMLAEMEKQKPGQYQQRSHHVTVDIPPTLADIGITKNESSRWQKLAAVDDEKFEKAVSAAKEVAGEVTTAAMLRVEREAKAITAVKEAEPTPAVAVENPKKEAVYLPEPKDDDMHAEMLADAMEALREENESLSNQIAAMLFSGTEEEKARYLARLDELTEENRKLHILNRGLTEARDRVMLENVSLRKQGEYSAKKLKALAKCAAA